MKWLKVCGGLFLAFAVVTQFAGGSGVIASFASKIAYIVLIALLTIVYVAMINLFAPCLGLILDFPLARLVVSAFTTGLLWYLYAGFLAQVSENLGTLFLNNIFICVFMIIGTSIFYFVYEP